MSVWANEQVSRSGAKGSKGDVPRIVASGFEDGHLQNVHVAVLRS